MDRSHSERDSLSPGKPGPTGMIWSEVWDLAEDSRNIVATGEWGDGWRSQ